MYLTLTYLELDTFKQIPPLLLPSCPQLCEAWMSHQLDTL